MLGATKLDDLAALLFVGMAVIIVAARLAGLAARRLRQPPVVGEIIVGLLLGPSLLGAFPGDPTGLLFPDDVRPFLNVVAQIGLVIFMFIVGLELDLALVRGRERVAGAISLSSIALPFVLGVALAVRLHGGHAVVGGKRIEFLPFALFIGAAMSITAFPVLARILADRGMFRTPLGALTLACAAVDDVVAWSLLALVLTVVASSSAWQVPLILAESVVFVVVMLALVRPVLARFIAGRTGRGGPLPPDVLAVVIAGTLLSSFVTAEIGIHQIFGAFLFGVIMPREGTGALLAAILERLESVTVLVLLPVFFIATGLEADVRGIGLSGLPELLLILLVACAGKFVGAAAAARATGLDTRRAAAVGILMNTRGLTELVILNVGFSFGVLDRQLFTMLVVMAIATTVMTGPVLRVVYPERLLRADVAEAERGAVGARTGYRVLVSVGDPAHAARMVNLALDLMDATSGGPEASELVITRFAPRVEHELDAGLVLELTRVDAGLAYLHDLATRGKRREVRTSVLYQFSSDPAADLAAQAASIEADLLLVGAPRSGSATGEAALAVFQLETGFDFDMFLRTLVALVPCPLGVLVHPVEQSAPPGPGAPVVLAAAGVPADELAATLARQVAAARGAPVVDAVPAQLELVSVAGWADGGADGAPDGAIRGALVVTAVDASAPDPLEPLAPLISRADTPVLVVRAPS